MLHISRPAVLGAAILWTLFVSGCATTSGGGKVYKIRVEAGDTLAGIATKYDTTPEKIARLNGIESGAELFAGRVIRLVPGPAGIVARSGKSPRGHDGSEDLDEDSGESARPAGKRKGLFFNGGGGDDEEARIGAGTAGGRTTGGRARMNWPVYGDVSSVYGKRDGSFHHGIDIRARTGTAVFAAAPGVVEFAGRQNGYGRLVIVNHGNMRTYYAHLDSIDVRKGRRVTSATEIGTVGTSGNATGPHLHFEVRNMKNQSLDPRPIIGEDRLLSWNDR